MILKDVREGKQCYLQGRKPKTPAQKVGYRLMLAKHKVARKLMKKQTAPSQLVKDGCGYRIKQKQGDMIVTWRV